MKLLDVANVERPDRVDYVGEFTSRECGVEILLTEFCDATPTDTAVVGSPTSAPGAFKSIAFPIDGFLRRNTFCNQPDDLAWFAQSFTQKLEFVLTWALTIEATTGTESWTGATGVQSVTLAGTTTAQRVAGIYAARRQWFKSVIAPAGPILHLPPSWGADMKAAGLLNDSNTTVNGDPVVLGDGYDEHPQAFWTGPITIVLGALNKESVPRARLNDAVHVMDQVARFDVAPCSIVRVGAYS